MNNCTFVGRLGTDPEKRMAGESKVASFTLAVRRRKRDEPPLWIKCQAFRKVGEIAAEYLSKGSEVAVSGEINLRTWKKRDGGGLGFSLELNVNNLSLIGGRKDRETTEPVDRPSRPPERDRGYPSDWDETGAPTVDPNAW